MSIVEKALSKIDKTAVRAARLRENARAAAPAHLATPASTALPPLSPEAGPYEVDLPARERIDIDIDELRRKGSFPPADIQHRVLDQFRRIKWPLLARPEGTPQDILTNFIMVTSALPGEGKTFITLNLAFSMTLERDSQVLVIDSDVAKQDLTRQLGLANRPGLMDFLLDERLRLEDVIYDTNIEGLRVMPAGRRAAHAPELFGSRRMGALYDAVESRVRNRVVLIDCSPLLAANEATVIARDVDRVLFVVRAESTVQSHVKEALALLESTANVACVLNQAKISSKDGYYGDYALPADPPVKS